MEYFAEQSPLGKHSDYPSRYDPELLYPIPRAGQRQALGVAPDWMPYHGMDIWHSYELSWLSPSGKPVVAIGEFQIPACSPYMIESKSFKLYLNSLNQQVFSDYQAVQQCLAGDLSRVAGITVHVQIRTLEEQYQLGLGVLPGECVDDLEVKVPAVDKPRPDWLVVDPQQRVQAVLHSHLLKSNCPVTGQPDWASVVVEYEGQKLEPASFLCYLVSYRQHADFHEQCVERIFLDLQRCLVPDRLTVYARYVRRGGVDINPLRSTEADTLEQYQGLRLVRQ